MPFELVVLYFGDFHDPFERLGVAVHGNFDSFRILHVLNYFCEVRDCVAGLNPLPRQQHFFWLFNRFGGRFLAEEDFNKIEVKRFLFINRLGIRH